MAKERDTVGEKLTELLKGVGKDIYREAGNQFDMGCSELAAGMFRNYDGFVMYPREQQQEHQPLHGPEPEKEQERGGREM